MVLGRNSPSLRTNITSTWDIAPSSGRYCGSTRSVPDRVGRHDEYAIVLLHEARELRELERVVVGQELLARRVHTRGSGRSR